MTQRERRNYRQTKKWKEFRAFLLDEAEHRCWVCNGFKRKGLQIHHVNPQAYGKEEPIDCVVLCNSCHRELERLLRKKKLDIEEYQKNQKWLYEEGKMNDSN